jgi:hypothetical protein
VYADINGLKMFCEIRGTKDPGAHAPTQFAVLQGTSYIGVTGRADMLMTMIPAFLDAP